MLRVMGSVLVAAGCLSCALQASGREYERLATEQALCRALELAEREMGLKHTPLPELMERLSHCGDRRAEELFRRVVSEIEKGKSFTEAWVMSIWGCGLDPATARALEPLADLLGGYDASGQCEAVRGVRRELADRLGPLREQARRRRRVVLALGGAAAGALILMLL